MSAQNESPFPWDMGAPADPQAPETPPAPADLFDYDTAEDVHVRTPPAAGVTPYGYVYDLEAEAYHAPKNQLSVSGAKVLAYKTPKHFAHYRDNRVHKKVFDLGTAAHSVALEGDSSNLVAIPSELLASNGAASTVKAKAFIAEAAAKGQIALKEEELESIFGMAAELKNHEAAEYLLSAGRPEVSAYRTHPETGVVLRARFDWLPDGRAVIPDYKTTTDTSPDAMQKIASRLRYFMQDAWYADMVAELDGIEAPAFVFIMQERTAPYAVNILELDETARAYGRQMNERAIARFAKGMATGDWTQGWPLSAGPVPLARFTEIETEGLMENDD